MVRDVYAADEHAGDEPIAVTATVVFRVVMDEDPQGPARVLGVLAMGNIAPVSVVGRYGSHGSWAMEVVVHPMTLQTADYLSRKVAQLTCVHEATFEIAERPSLVR